MEGMVKLTVYEFAMYACLLIIAVYLLRLRRHLSVPCDPELLSAEKVRFCRRNYYVQRSQPSLLLRSERGAFLGHNSFAMASVAHFLKWTTEASIYDERDYIGTYSTFRLMSANLEPEALRTFRGAYSCTRPSQTTRPRRSEAYSIRWCYM